MTVVLDQKSEARELFYFHPKEIPVGFYAHSHTPIEETVAPYFLLSPSAEKKRLQNFWVQLSCCQYVETAWQNDAYRGFPESPVYFDSDKIRGIQRIKPPPNEFAPLENTESQKLNLTSANQLLTNSGPRLQKHHLRDESAPSLLFASLSSNYSEFFNLSYSGSAGMGRAPQLECPEDISTYTDINECTAFIASGLNPGFDEAEVVLLTWEMSGATSDASPLQGINLIDDYTFSEGATIVTYIATAADGTTNSCSFTVTISDNQVPRLESMPADITVETAPGSCSARVYWIEPTATDNCTPSHLILKKSTARPGDEFPVGTTLVQYTAYDAMDNGSGVRSFTITVKDAVPPVLLLPAGVTVQCEDPIPEPWQSWQQMVAVGGNVYDNCELDESSFTLLSENASSATCPYTITRIYQVADAAGNLATAEHVITVEGEEETAQPDQQEEVTLKSTMAEIISTSAGGNWNDPTTWVGGVVPGIGDNVTIASGATVTVNTNAFCDDILIESGGILEHGGAFTLQVNGNWTNNGTYNGGTNGIVEFAGANSATIIGTTTFEEVIVSKGSLSNRLNINGNVTIGSGGSLTLNGGLITIGSGNSLSLNYSSGLTIPEEAGFDVTGGTLTTGNFTITNNGLIRVSSGTANLGTTSGNSVNTQYDGAFVVSGGTVNIAGRLHNSASGTLNPPGVSSGIHVTGGTVTLSTAGQSLSSVGSLNVTPAGTFIFTGGTIVFQTPSSASTELDLGLSDGTGTKNTNGGTFQFGNASSPSNSTFNVSSDVPLHTVTTAGNADLVLEDDLVISGQLSLNGSSQLLLNGNTIQIPVSTGTNTLTLPLADDSGNSIPVVITINGVTSAGHITVFSFASAGTIPAGLSPTRLLNRYWEITGSGFSFSSYSATFNYLPGDLAGGATSGQLKMYHTDISSNTTFPLFTSGSNSFTVSGLTTFGEFGAAECGGITISGDLTDLTCFESGNGEIDLTVSGGAGALTYSWSGPGGFSSSIEDITGLDAGTYSITVSDEAGCEETNSFAITQPAMLSATIGSTDVSCNGGNDGSITVTGAAGGYGTFGYSIDGGTTWQSGTSFTGLSAGTYNVQIRDGAHTTCIIVLDASFEITQPAILSATIGSTDVSCNGGSDGAITITGASGGYGTYEYSNNGGTTWQSGNSFAGLSAGTYNVQIRDAAHPACIIVLDASFAISQPAILSATIGSTDVSCNGGSDGAISITGASGGYGTYEYSNNGGTTWQSGNSFAGLSAGTYNVQIRDAAHATCIIVLDASFSITQPDEIAFNTPSVSEVTCAGVNDGEIVISANGGAGTISYSISPATGTQPTSGNFTGLSAQAYTITATDANSCTETISVTVGTIDDVTDPVISGCPADITFNTQDGNSANCGQAVSWTEPTATDNCALVSFTGNYSPGDVFPVGTTTVIYTATDASGNTSTCSFDVNVVDNTPPTFSVPDDLTVNANAACDPPNLDPNVTLSKPYNLSDNCTASGSLTTLYSDGARIPTGVCEGNYTIVRTWTVTDAAGNSSSQEQTITVVDNSKPVINVPANITIACSDNDDPDVNLTLGKATATDNCTAIGNIVIDYTDNITPGTCDSRYTITRTWTATDACGNFNSGTQTINVTDIIAPVVTMPTLTVSCPSDIPDAYTTMPEFEADGGIALDDCGGTTIALLFNNEISYGLANKPGYCPDYVERTYRFTDPCGNFVDVVQTINVDDECGCSPCDNNTEFGWVDFLGDPHGDTIFYNVTRAGKCCADDDWWAQPGAKNLRCISYNVRIDFDAVGVQITMEGGATPEVKDWRVDCEEVSLMDGDIICLPSGEFHLFTYCKQGNNPNDISFHSVPGIVASDDIVTRVDCGSQITTDGDFTDPQWTSISPGNRGDWDHYLDLTDPFNPFFVADGNAPPVIEYEVCGTFPNYVCSATGTNCDTILVYVYDDIEIDLNINPDMVCDDDALPLITPDVSPASNTYVLDWYSGYGATGTLLCADCPSFQPPVGGAGAYSVRVTDVREGIPCSQETFDFDITFDYTGPTVQAPPDPLVIICNDPSAPQQIQDWLAQASAEYTDPAGNIVPADITHDFSGIDMICGEQVTVTFSAEDQCVNVNTAQSTITVADDVAPTWVTTAADGNSECSSSNPDDDPGYQDWLANHGGATATDNCDDDLAWSDNSAMQAWSGDPANNQITITFTVTDDCGNTAETTAAYSIVDTQRPTITCPGDVEEIASLNQCSKTLAALTDPVMDDNCSVPELTYIRLFPDQTTDNGSGTVTGLDFPVGVTEVIYIATDAAGLKDSCFFFVTIVDVTPPVIDIDECVDLEETAAPDNCSKTLVNFNDPSYTDTCWPIDSLTLSWRMEGATTGQGEGSIGGEVFNLGVTTVTFIVADPDGNKDSCEFDVTIIHNEVPERTFTCPESPVVQNVDPGSCEATVTLSAPVIDDPCDEIESVWNNSPYRTAPDNASGVYPIGTTTFNWYITDISGNIDSCAVEVIVNDNIDPVIGSLPSLTECPEFVVPVGSLLLNLDELLISDNCQTNCSFDEYTIRWRIDFNDGSSLPAGSGTYNTGQISDYGTNILFPSDSATHTSLTHEITYWVEDCGGNLSDPQTRTVTVLPPVIAVPPGDTLSYCHLETVDAIPLTGYPSGVVFDISGGAALGVPNQTGVTEIPSFWASQTGTAVITITPHANECTGAPVTFVLEIIPRAIPQITPPFDEICSGETTNISLSSSIPEATFSFTVSSITPAGSVTGAFDDTGNLIAQQLINTTTEVATVVYQIVAEANGCTSPGTSVATVTVNPTPELVITDPDVICEPGTVDLTDAAVTAGSSAGLTYTYWTDAAATSPLPNPDAVAASGTYYIKGTSAAGCVAVMPVQVVINPLPELTSPLDPDGICSNEPFFYEPESNIPGTDFVWTRDAVPGISNPAESGVGVIDEILVNETSSPIEVTYVYTLTVDGCSNTQEVKVTVTQSPVLTSTDPPGICSGQVFSYTPTSNIAGTTFSWTRNADSFGNSTASGTGNPSEVLVNNSSSPITVIYYYTLSSNNCTNPEVFQVKVTVTPSPNVTVNASRIEICPGESINLFSSSDITSNLPTTLLTDNFNSGAGNWAASGNSTWQLQDDGYSYTTPDWWWAETTTFHSDDNSRFYLSNHYDTDATSYLTSTSINTEGYTSVTLSFWHYYRRGSTNEEAVVEYSTNGTNWIPLENYTVSRGTSTNFENRTISLPVGIANLLIRFRYRTYSGWWQSAHYWWAIDNVNVTGEPQSQADVEWTANTSSWTSTEANPANVFPGVTTTYTATYTDPDTNCPGSSSITVVVRETPNVSIAADYCIVPPKIRLSVGNFASYEWSTGETTQYIDVDVAGNFFVTVTDAFGCSGRASYNTANELVVNGDFEAGNTGFSSGYTYWPDDPNSNSELFSEGTYSVGTDGQNYHSDFWGHDHTSGQGNFMIVNGENNSTTTIWAQTVTIEPNTNYYFSAWTMSLNDKGNDAELQFYINGSPQGTSISPPAGVSNPSNNGWVRFYSTPLWNSGSLSGDIEIRIVNIEPALGGNDFGLDDISFGTLDPAPATIEIVAESNPVCEGDSIKLTMEITDGREPFTYNWTGPNGFTANTQSIIIPNADASHSGEYVAVLTDDYGCGPVSDNIEIIVNPAATVDAGPDQEVCASDPDVQLAGSYGGAASSVTWETLGTGTFSSVNDHLAVYTLSAADTTAGLVTLVLATDDPAGICEAVTDTMNIIIHPEVYLAVDTLENPLCPNGADGYITVVASGGTAPYTYLWSDGQTLATAGGLSAGTYSVTVTDASGCQDTISATLTDPPALEVSDVITTTPVTCYDGSDGTATVTVISGDNPTFSWSNGSTEATAEGLSAGQVYYVTVFAENGCSSVGPIPVTVTQPEPPSVECPEDVTAWADYGKDYASNVELEAPEYTNDCPLVDQVWKLTGVTAGNSAPTGIDTLKVYDFNVGVTTVTYTFEDEAGNKSICSFTVTVESKPDIECPPNDTLYLGDTGCTAALDPGVPSVLSGAPPFDWTWTMEGVTTGSGVTNGAALPDPIGVVDFDLGLTTITWTAENLSGADTCSHTILVIDTIPPTFTATQYENCVDPLHSAVYDPNSPNPIVNHVDPNLEKVPSPDYRTFPAGDTSLDILDLQDNCCDPPAMVIQWRIDFTAVPDPLTEGATISKPSISGTGQPSEYGNVIYLWGDGVYYTERTHTITYWVEDCNGNTSDELVRDIVITPRPEIIKITGQP
ncbi:HYR domain-containing protein [Mariniphaga anaerophila]|nr:HYR domain-containing protein [Mariniphaga anaerophila]